MNERVLIPWRSMPLDMKLERVKALTAEGKTASEIAAIINTGIPAYNHTTKNAIIGFWGRNGITSQSNSVGGWSPDRIARAQEAREERHRISAQVEADKREAMGKRNANLIARNTIAARKARSAVPAPHPPKVAVMTVADLPTAGVPMLERTGFTCRSVREDKDQYGLAMMCGSPVHREESSWCEYHARLYTRPLPARTGVRPNYARRG